MEIELGNDVANGIIDSIKQMFTTNYYVLQGERKGLVEFHLYKTYDAYLKNNNSWDIWLFIFLNSNSLRCVIQKELMIRNNFTSKNSIEVLGSFFLKKYSTGFHYSETGSLCDYQVKLKSNEELKSYFN